MLDTVKYKKKFGFTLVELMVVIGIIMIITTVAIPMYSNYIIKSKFASELSKLETVKVEVSSFLNNNGSLHKLNLNNLGGVPVGTTVNSGSIVLDTSNITPNSRIFLTPTVISDSIIKWDCNSFGFLPSQTPSSCSTDFNIPISESPIIDLTKNYSNRSDSPSGEGSPNVLDNDSSTKFLTFNPSDTTLDVDFNNPQYATTLTITSANDATEYPGRDPKEINIYGINSSGEREFISTNTLNKFTSNQQEQEVAIDRSTNTSSYATYQVEFESTQDSNNTELQLSDLNFA
jgi:type IV pilus assembly protein PilA